MEKNDVIGTVAKGFAKSTRNIHEINKKNLEAIKADTRAGFETATTPDPGFEKVMQAEGLGNKVRTIAENIKDSARENSAKEKERRAEIQNHSSYQTLLEEQRAKRSDASKN